MKLQHPHSGRELNIYSDATRSLLLSIKGDENFIDFELSPSEIEELSKYLNDFKKKNNGNDLTIKRYNRDGKVLNMDDIIKEYDELKNDNRFLKSECDGFYRIVKQIPLTDAESSADNSKFEQYDLWIKKAIHAVNSIRRSGNYAVIIRGEKLPAQYNSVTKEWNVLGRSSKYVDTDFNCISPRQINLDI